MKLITNIRTLIIAIIGVVGGLIWAFLSHWDPEPIILVLISSLEIIAFGAYSAADNGGEQSQPLPSINNRGDVNVNVNVGVNPDNGKDNVQSIQNNVVSANSLMNDREAIIEIMKSKTKILFIDDDKNFNVVKILKNGGWKHTKSIVDVKSIDIPAVKDAHIYFVDINGVGRLLTLAHEGLDLALMIKQKYPDKKVIIYSANRNSNAFHDAWDICDFKLEKNALPNQFQNLVEQCSIELYKK